MKVHCVFIIIGILWTSFATQGQQLRFSVLYEKTVAGNQYGSHISFQTKHHWNLGAFYQSSLQRTSEVQQHITNPFYGVSVSAPLIQSGKVIFYFNTRCGLVNKYFVIVAPGLETELNLSKVFSVSTLMSIRMTYPSAMVKASIKF